MVAIIGTFLVLKDQLVVWNLGTLIITLGDTMINGDTATMDPRQIGLGMKDTHLTTEDTIRVRLHRARVHHSRTHHRTTTVTLLQSVATVHILRRLLTVDLNHHRTLVQMVRLITTLAQMQGMVSHIPTAMGISAEPYPLLLTVV